MSEQRALPAWILGVSLIIGLSALGFLLGKALLDMKQLERSVTVKGLSEHEYPADVVIWPITFTEADNDLNRLYQTMEAGTAKIGKFLADKNIDSGEITINAPAITDKSAQQYGGGMPAEFRYTATQTVTVYSENIAGIRKAMAGLSELGKQGLVLSGDNYQSQSEYLFTRLNEVKPKMIEEATQNAREVAEKFADDSNSNLGKIKQASQGQFSISARDNNNPHIKKVRVVSTIEYYLSD
ncbi:MAG TPA: SIMPL domain-containing protein [Methylophaga sp.]|nr:SIMPL domain-containing protein [Methylophaga sp.]